MNIVLLENLGCTPALMAENEARLRELGHTFKSFSRTSDPEKLKDEVRDADVIMLANMPLPAEVLDAARNVKFIDVAFTGVDHIPMADAKKRNIAVSNASGYANESVAELVICFMIQLLRDLKEAEKRCRISQTREGLSARLMQGKTVGIIGAGAIGRRVAALSKAMGARVIAHNLRHQVEDKNIDAYTDLDELLATSDIVTLHCPLTPETKGMIGKNELEKMKKNAVFINCARGPIVDNAALAQALNNDVIAGAACDVFDMEPPLPLNYPLLHSKNTIVTPHLAFYSEESMEDRAKTAFENLYSWLDGKQINKM